MEREPFAPDEWYHCYSRGVDKRKTFQSSGDYLRFIEYLYLCNSSKVIHRSDYQNANHTHILQIPRGDPIIAIGGYCLMPNHFHLLLKEIADGGISRFMRALGTAYAMYFNIKNERTGNLFVKPFRSRHIGDDQYLRKVTQYIHLNPIELFEPGWKEGRIKRSSSIEKRLRGYLYSSLPDYLDLDKGRPEKVILDENSWELISDGLPRLSNLIDEATAYRASLSR